MGAGRIGDFSAWTRPGVYRLVLPNEAGRSLVFFTINDGVLADLPRLYLDYLDANRCGGSSGG